MTDVVITGVGAVTCHGTGVRALRAAMATAAARPPEKIPDPDARMRLPLIHQVPQPDPDRAGTVGPATRFALAAAAEAVGDAGGVAMFDPMRTAVVVGTCMGEPVPAGPGWHAAFPIAAAVADRYRLGGPVTSLSNACAASGYAIAVAVDLIRSGEVDVVLTGGADAYARVGWACFDRLGAIDPVRCRPFDRHRAGTILGEGAGMLVLESTTHARDRVASGYATITGTGWSCDGYHLTAPDPDARQITRAMVDALAGRGADRVGCVVPHGTGTRLNDEAEVRALRQVFGDRLGGLPAYSLKALIGHTGGAAAALATVTAALIARFGSVPPNVALDEPDPDCDVYLPAGAPVPLLAPGVLVNAYAFGGSNASLLLEGVAAGG